MASATLAPGGSGTRRRIHLDRPAGWSWMLGAAAPMTDRAPQTPSPEFLEVFSRHAGSAGAMSFARFMKLALYDPAVGYYARPRRRIARDPAADFYTAPTLGPVFGDLVAAASAALLAPGAPADHPFVEIGVEPAAGPVLAGVKHPFGAVTGLGMGQSLAIPPRAVVFSNELFDAQPFHPVVRGAGAWRECGVARHGDRLEEVLLPAPTPDVRAVLDRLPSAAPDGYRIDLPLGAARLAAHIAALPWTGLFVAVDYGKSWRELAEETPNGTARAYHQHQQVADLLARPGEQDLTCHICWDWLVDELTARGFAPPTLESQEAFFVHHAADVLRAVTAAEAAGLSARKLAVMQLLHPGNMGQKFQVLWARRHRG